MKPIVFQVGHGRTITMTADDVKLFRDEYRQRGNSWNVLCYCTGCGVVCFEGNLCDCPGHTAARRAFDIANHCSVASIPDVLERIKEAMAA